MDVSKVKILLDAGASVEALTTYVNKVCGRELYCVYFPCSCDPVIVDNAFRVWFMQSACASHPILPLITQRGPLKGRTFISVVKNQEIKSLIMAHVRQ